MSKHFFEDFEKVSKKEWLEKATKDLKGTDPIEKFGWEIEPGLKVAPYYSKEDIDKSIEAFQNRLVENDHPSASVRHWDNLQTVLVKDEQEANKKALNGLEGGAEGIIFELDENVDFDKLTKDIKLEYCSVWFKVNSSQSTVDAIAQYFNDKPVNGTVIINGDLHSVDLTQLFSSKFRVASDAQQDATSFTEKVSDLLIQSVAIAKKYIGQNFSADDFFNSYTVLYPVDTNFFGEIAGMRALRKLFFQIAKAFEANQFEPESLHLCAISKAWSTEEYNPHANMLKGTTAGMSGILGGCNSLIVEPEDISNVTMTRIARNVSNILKEESYLNSAVDPVAGSYYIESLSEQIAQEAWKKFQQKINK